MVIYAIRIMEFVQHRDVNVERILHMARTVREVIGLIGKRECVNIPRMDMFVCRNLWKIGFNLS